MTTQMPAQCFACARLRPSATPTGPPAAVTCDAYPDGIPVEISRSASDHRRARGDERNGLVFKKAAGPRADFDLESWELWSEAQATTASASR
jgi:hypothetical protein